MKDLNLSEEELLSIFDMIEESWVFSKTNDYLFMCVRSFRGESTIYLENRRNKFYEQETTINRRRNSSLYEVR
jgi:hypothetical protein